MLQLVSKFVVPKIRRAFYDSIRYALYMHLTLPKQVTAAINVTVAEISRN